ncbi:MAG: hypothetical protein J0M04_03410 [Verrucomicrobia bacterium]|nr:hypothetical protein [Verrucomicrobiota bacterium]
MRTIPLLTAILAAGYSLANAAITDNLVAYWNFEGNANNHSSASGGSAYNGALTGGATTAGTPRVGSGALGLDGVNDYMDVTSMVNVNAAWSIQAWFRAADAPPQVSGNTSRYFVFENPTNGTMSFALRGYETATLPATANTRYQVYTVYNATNPKVAEYDYADTYTALTWHHVVLAFVPPTASVAGSLVWYLDGKQRATYAIPAAATMGATSGLRVGTYRNADARWFKGAIDEVAIWNRTLSPSDVADALHRGQANLAITDPAPAANVRASLLAYYNFEETGASGLANKAPGASSYGGTRGQWSGSDPDWAAGADATGPGFAGNAAFNGEGGTSNRSALLTGNALNLSDSRNEFVNVPIGTAQLGQTFTISAWHKLTPASGNNSNRYHVFEPGDTGNYDVSWGTNAVTTTTGPYSSYTYLAYLAGGTSGGFGPTAVSTDSWHHVTEVVTTDGTKSMMSVYLDGAFVEARTEDTSAMSFTSINLGRARPAADDRDWDGLMDEVALWNRALSPAEVQVLYQAGIGGTGVNAGLIPANDNLTKPAGNQPFVIAVADLLANDRRALTNGNLTASGITLTSVTAGGGNTVSLGTGPDAGWIFFTPSAASPETFSYTATDGTNTATATVTVTTEGAPPAFNLQVVSRGTAVYDGGSGSTSVTHDFTGIPGQTYQIQWSTDLTNWTTISGVAAGPTGSFSVTISAAGDHASAWNSSMFFRASL